MSYPQLPSRTVLCARIDALIASLQAQARAQTPLSLVLSRNKTLFFPPGSSAPGNRSRASPSSTSCNDPRTFTIYVYLLTQILGLLKSNSLTTKRDIYYRNVPLFKSQLTVDKAVDSIAAELGVSRLDLNVVASPKSCVFVHGSLSIFGSGGQVLDLSNDSLIPVDIPFQYIRLSAPVSVILVIEKEAVYRQLCTSMTLYSRPEMSSPLLITGKGFPDLSCRQFLAALCASHPEVPVYALVDSDPHGILIFLNYKLATPKQKKMGTAFPTERLQYLGVSLSDYRQLGSCGTAIPLTQRDVAIAMSILQSSHIIQREDLKPVLRELQLGLFLQKKAEMNNATTEDEEVGNSIVSYVQSKLRAVS